MATVTKPIALDESINTTEVSPRNVADVLAQELANIATAIGGSGGSGGHTIENSSGTALPQRTNLQFGSGLGVTDDAVNDATVVELTGESVHANMLTKLWENPDPSALFTPQTITLASDDYDFLLMIYRRSGNYTDAEGIIVPKGTNATLSYANATGSGAESQTRTVVRNSDTSYAFGDAYEASGTTARTVNNNRIVPTVIYGFKKSLDITAIVSNVSTDARQCMLSDGVTSVEDKFNEVSVGAVVNLGDISSYTPSVNGYLSLATSDTAANAFVAIQDADSSFVIASTPAYNANIGCSCVGYVLKGRTYVLLHRTGTKTVKFMPASF